MNNSSLNDEGFHYGQQQQRHYHNRNQNLPSNQMYEHPPQVYQNSPLGERHSKANYEYNRDHKDGYSFNESQRHSNVPPLPSHDHTRSPYHHSEGQDFTSKPGSNNSNSWNLPPSSTVPNYAPGYNLNGCPPRFAPNQFLNINVPPPPLPPPQQQSSLYADGSCIPPTVAAMPQYPTGQQLPIFPSVDTSCPPPQPPPYMDTSCPPPYINVSSQENSCSNPPSVLNLSSNISIPTPLSPNFTPPPNDSNIKKPIGFSTSADISLPDLSLGQLKFNVPPPVYPVYGGSFTKKTDCSLTVESKNAENENPIEVQRQKDQDWLNQTFPLRSLARTAVRQQSIKICDAQKMVRDMLILTAQLQQQSKSLELIQTTASKDVWLAEVTKIETMQRKLEELRKKVTDKQLLQQLEEKVKQKHKRRERSKRSRMKKYEEKEATMAFRKELHRRLAEWRDSISQKEQQIKQDKEMKVTVDSVLGEVRKKKSDVAKTLELIKILSKLRKVRKENVAKRGLYTLFHCDQKFEEDIVGLQRMLKSQMEVYDAEQRTLMVMLECEQEETKERERVQSHKVKAEIEKREKRREHQLLFGKDAVDLNDPRYPYMKYYTQAEDNWEAFLQIRRDWDCYLAPEYTPGASRIPDIWVLPVEPSDAIWASALES